MNNIKNRKQKMERLGEENYNKNGCLMRIIEYNECHDIIVEFQDAYRTKVHAAYHDFKNGDIRNPYYPSVCNIGITGCKYPTRINGKPTKEYTTWCSMILRCFNNECKEKYTTYQNVTCCNEWLLFENFYEWLHSQENFDKWFNGKEWAIDKDILVKGNKIYSPETCCLVPQQVNKLFVNLLLNRSGLPIGVIQVKNTFLARCKNTTTHQQEHIGSYHTPEQAFLAYKKRKEEIIKQVAEIEYAKGNITQQCYEAMMRYEVEITD